MELFSSPGTVISCQGMEAFPDFRLRDIKSKNKRNNSTQSH